MKIYTGNGDRGNTSLVQSKNISKSDDRVQLIGSIEELISQIGLIKTMLTENRSVIFLEKIQRRLMTLSAGVSDPYKRDYRIPEEAVRLLEQEIDWLDSLFERPVEPVLPGGNRLSAQIDITWAVARRTERDLALVGVRYGADQGSKKYMNRLADYLHTLARYEDAVGEHRLISMESDTADENRLFSAGPDLSGKSLELSDKADAMTGAVAPSICSASLLAGGGNQMDISRQIVQEVLRHLGICTRIDLNLAKRLMETVESEAKRQSLKAAIAVCSPEGNPIAVHIMEGAGPDAFHTAVKRAHEAAVGRISTDEQTGQLRSGQSSGGLDRNEHAAAGGGTALIVRGTVMGGLGIGGTTEEESHRLTVYGAAALQELMKAVI